MPVAILSLSFSPLLDYCLIKKEPWLPQKHLPDRVNWQRTRLSTMSVHFLCELNLQQLAVMLFVQMKCTSSSFRDKCVTLWVNLCHLAHQSRFILQSHLICFSLNIRGGWCFYLTVHCQPPCLVLAAKFQLQPFSFSYVSMCIYGIKRRIKKACKKATFFIQTVKTVFLFQV